MRVLFFVLYEPCNMNLWSCCINVFTHVICFVLYFLCCKNFLYDCVWLLNKKSRDINWIRVILLSCCTLLKKHLTFYFPFFWNYIWFIQKNMFFLITTTKWRGKYLLNCCSVFVGFSIGHYNCFVALGFIDIFFRNSIVLINDHFPIHQSLGLMLIKGV